MIIHTLETMAWQLQTCVSQEKYLIGSRTSLSLDGVEQIFVPKIHQEMYHKYEHDGCSWSPRIFQMNESIHGDSKLEERR